jgi:hypothetical protein
MADFKLNRFKFTWKGSWQSSSRYNPDDIVSFNSNVYVCLESHTSNFDFYADLNFLNNDIPPVMVPRWELMAEGKSWLGNWTPSTYYVIGDTVKLGGTTYICVEPHISADQEADFSSQISFWTVQINSIDWKIEWNTDTYYKVNDLVRYGGITYICNTPHLSAADFDAGLEANQSSWDIVNVADLWQGDWSLSTRYKINDIVKYGGLIYKCLVPHESASVLDDGLESDLAKWGVLYENYEFQGEWQDSNRYKINDIVKYGSYLYYCITPHVSGGALDIQFFSVFCPGFEFDNEWSASTVYQEGDVVRYGGNLYVSLSLNSNQVPSTAESAWQLFYQNSRIRDIWSSLTQYRPGDVVRRGGNLYLAKLDSINQDPDILEDGSSTNQEFWDLVLPGVRWRGVWAPNTIFVVGDTVVWISSSYKCLDNHVSDSGNRPDDDPEDGSTLRGRYWAKITEGNRINRLSNVGDLRTFGDTGDGSTIGFTRLSVGTQGRALTSEDSNVVWKSLQSSDDVYYVATFGEDIPTAGTTAQSPWRTVRYATERITGYATIFVRTGIYEEVLPIRIPAFVAVVGDELRSTVVKPAENLLSEQYVEKISQAANYLESIGPFVIQHLEIGNPTQAPLTVRYSTINQDFSGDPATQNEANSLTSTFQSFSERIINQNPVTISGTNNITTSPGALAARAQISNNREFLKNEATLFLQDQYPSFILPTRWNNDLDNILDAILYDFLYPGNWKIVELGTYFINASNADKNKSSNMFLLRDGTGLRNMTLSGLKGTLGDPNAFLTKRPSAGAYASLDPGWGPSDSTAWVGSKSPYVQNVSTFGDACIGLKIDGDLHSGGNQTIVSNDFTQILSDGIGVWANGTGRTEAVSVFTYYNHIGYLSTNGGKIRGTNGNCSYGTFGAVSEGFNISETPITGLINNRYYDADIAQVLVGSNAQILKFLYSNAGQSYTSANFQVIGSGLNASVVGDEIRDGAVFEARIVDPGDSSAAGGSGYVFTTNASQGGDLYSITISASDQNQAEVYRNMRIFVSRGTGTGQYGYVVDIDETSKIVIVGDESKPTTVVQETQAIGNILTVGSTAHLSVDQPISFSGTKFGNIQDTTVYFVKTINGPTEITITDTIGGATFGLLNGIGSMTLHYVGWDHVIEGTPILSLLDTTSNYSIEPRPLFSSPGFTSSAVTMPDSRRWSSIAYGEGLFVAVIYDSSTFAYSATGQTWIVGNLPADTLWRKIKFVGGVFMAFAVDGEAARSEDGISWSSMTMPTTASWTDVSYGNGIWVAVADGGTVAARSTNGQTWTSQTLPEGADWNAVEFGKGLFVATALSDSTVTATAYSENGIAWSISAFASGCISLAYGNNRFVAIEGGFPGADQVAISFDGITWINGTIEQNDWRSVTYGQGLFVAVAFNTNIVAISNDGLVWEYQNINATAPWVSVIFGNTNKPGSFIAIAGLTSNTSVAREINSGVKTKARAVVVAGRISELRIWEPGSGYVSAPAYDVIDPNASSPVSVEVRIADGVLGPPTIVNSGTGFSTASTRATITGDGFKDQFPLGSEIVVTGLSRIPRSGDNVNISGINDYTYKLLNAIVLEGVAPNITAILRIAKDLNRAESPAHNTSIEIRQLYSQVRLTGHDFLDIGLGNFEQTNYPDTLFPNGTVLAPENEVSEKGGGRVFYTATDQDGNFRVGELFAVEQATGTVTLNAQFFELQGLEELALGGVTVGGSGTVIREFSTDATFTADSNNIIPTERAIRRFLEARVSGGGADAITGQLTAGIVRIGPNQISTTTNEELIIDATVNFLGGIDGDWLVQSYYMSTG